MKRIEHGLMHRLKNPRIRMKRIQLMRWLKNPQIPWVLFFFLVKKNQFFVLFSFSLSLVFRKETPRKTDQRGRHWPEKRKESTRGKKVRYNFYHFHIYIYIPTKVYEIEKLFFSRIGKYKKSNPWTISW